MGTALSLVKNKGRVCVCAVSTGLAYHKIRAEMRKKMADSGNSTHTHTPAPGNKKNIRGIRIRSLNLGMILVSCTLYIILILATIHAADNYNAMVRATSQYIACEKNAALVSKGSDYLTEQVRLFTVNANPEHIDNYFTEVNVTKRRNTALSQLREFQVTQDAYDFLNIALEHSNSLMEQEIYAMRLVAQAKGYDPASLPKEVSSIALPKEDLALLPQEMTARAQELVFGPAYIDAKALITENISSFIDSVVGSTEQAQAVSMNNLHLTMKGQQILISILFLENILIFILILRLIVKPLQIYVNNIRDEKMLEITGSYEFKYLALTYNNIYEINTANEAMLRHKAEHDPLTGLINRGTFDQLRQVLKTRMTPVALLIIDVDKFKLVNDGYGHEMGDRILKKVAGLLETGFRSTDYPARIGGDEFAVIMPELPRSKQDMLMEKVASMNQILLHPDNDEPPVSLSVGGAFSENGFSDDLYNRADTALYHVKENGRCGCGFFEE